MKFICVQSLIKEKSTHSWSELARPSEGPSCGSVWPRVSGSTETVAGGGRSAAVKIRRRRLLLLQIPAKSRLLEEGAGRGWKRTSSLSFRYRPRLQPWPVAGVPKERR
ncbi:hypothetical protein L3X38_027421 [Prunus dulcis]|uniref:Uncharacterized protein n=1 Tax=Prunus dulcis TaxID=3755 RepID=A0AAD4VMV7_PRUDU|nr:hypothetical protein L3X38_027421 [Prunus dulcis]